MTFAAKIADAWTVLPVGQPVALNGNRASWDTVMSWSVAQQEAFGVFVVPEPAAPPAGQFEAVRTLGGGVRPVWAVTYASLPMPTKADLLARAGAAFNARRDGGVTLPNGLRIKTDADSRGLISGAYSLTDVRPELVIDFRASDGWVQVDAATMQTVAVAVGSWVQACYSGWRGAEELIAAGALTTFADVDAAAAAVTLSG